MAEDSGKKIIFGFDVNGPDFQNTIDKIRALEQAAKGLADTLARANLAGAGGESPITGGVATPRPMGGGDLGGVAGGAGGRYNGPLLVRTAEINRNLKDFIPVLKEYAAEYTRLLTALSAPLPAGTSAADLLTAIASGGGARGVAGGRASSEGTVAPPAEGGGGRRRRGIWYEREGVLDYREADDDGGDDGTPPPPRRTRPAGGDDGGGGRGGGVVSTDARARYREAMQNVGTVAHVGQQLISNLGQFNEYEKQKAFIPVEARVGQASFDAYIRGKVLSGDMSFVRMLEDVGGVGALAQKYGLYDQAKRSLYLNEAQGVLGIGQGVGQIAVTAAAASRGGLRGVAAAQQLAPAAGTAGGSAAGAGTAGRVGGMDLFSGVGAGANNMAGGTAKILLSKAMLDANMPEASKQKNMIRFLEMMQGLPEYQDNQLFQQSKVQMIDMQRALGRVASSTGGAVTGQSAYNLAKALGVQYGISPQDTAGFAGMAVHQREIMNQPQLDQVMRSLMVMSTAGYSQGTAGSLSNMANFFQINKMGGGGGQFYAKQELDFLSKFSGSMNVQEAGIAAAQAGMMGFGGIASQQGMENYAQMLTSGAVNAQDVRLRGTSMAAFGQMSQIPLVQAMTLAKLKTDPLTRGLLTPQQQQVIMRMTPAELFDAEKLARIVDPDKKVTGDRLGQFATFGKDLVSNILQTVGSQVIGKETGLGQEIAKKRGSFMKVIEERAFKKDDVSQGLMSQAAIALSGVGDMGMTGADKLIELVGARTKPVSATKPAEAADPRLVGDYKIQLAAQQESLYAGMNNALTSMGQTFANAESEINAIISQLANNTTTSIGGMKVTGTTAR